MFLAPPPFVVCVAVATFRLHISAWRDLIWSSYCLSCIVKFPLVVVSYVNAALIAAISDSRFIRSTSISPCFTLFVIPYPTAPSVCSSHSQSRYASQKCTLKHTHVHLFAKTFSHMGYACVYTCVANIWAIPMYECLRSDKGEFTAIKSSCPILI